MDAVLAHIDHFLRMDARENLCLGTDFDGIESLPEGITGVESMEELYEQMLAHRFSEALRAGYLLPQPPPVPGGSAVNIQIFGKSKCFDNEKGGAVL